MAGYLKKVISKGKAEIAENIARMEKEMKLYAGDPSLDWCIGGWAKSRLNVIYGPSKSGKSAITVMAAAALQRQTGKYVIIYDSEYYYKDEADQAKRLVEFGLDLERTIIVSSNELAELFYGISDLEEDIKKKDIEVCAIIVDSWGGIQNTKAETKIADNKIEEAGNDFGGNAKYLNPILGQLLRIAAENDVTIFAVQHCIRDMATGGWHLLGGERLRFLSNRTVFVQGSAGKTGMLLEGETVLDQTDTYNGEIAVGKKVLARCEKSRSVVEGRKAEFFINFDECRYAKPELSLFNLATNLGVISHPVNPETGKVNNVWWQFGLYKFQGQAKTVEAIAADKDLYNRVLQGCLASKSKDAANGQVSDEPIVSKPADDSESGESSKKKGKKA